MTLDNLIGKSVEAITPNAAAIKRLLAAAELSKSYVYPPHLEFRHKAVIKTD
jgi:hypothetical protein